MPITRISGERANNTNKIYPEKTRQPNLQRLWNQSRRLAHCRIAHRRLWRSTRSVDGT